jgi:hypothetical protein
MRLISVLSLATSLKPRMDATRFRATWSGVVRRPERRTQLEAEYYGRPTVLELKGRTKLTAVPGVTIDWTRVLTKLS